MMIAKEDDVPTKADNVPAEAACGENAMEEPLSCPLERH
jgi:hypothetical protein